MRAHQVADIDPGGFTRLDRLPNVVQRALDQPCAFDVAGSVPWSHADSLDGIVVGHGRREVARVMDAVLGG